MIEDEYFASLVLRRFAVLRCRIFKERSVFRRLRFGCVARGDKLLQAQPLKVLREEEREVAPFGIVARQEDRLTSKCVFIKIEIGVDFCLYVVHLRVVLVLFGYFRRRKVFVSHVPAATTSATSPIFPRSLLRRARGDRPTAAGPHARCIKRERIFLPCTLGMP